MDPYFIAIAARSAERIIGVLLGGLAIYYGFRLFLVVPVETRGDGKIQLPGVSVVLAKAGPGIFFAAFGAIVILTSLMNVTKFEDGLVTYQGMAATSPKGAGAERMSPEPGRSAAPQDVARVRIAIQTLNCIRRLSSSGPKAISAADADVAVRDARLALLAGIWDDGAWGDFDRFRSWAAGGAGKTSSPARAIFEAERTDCPR